MKPLLLCAQGRCQLSGAAVFSQLDELSKKLLIEARKAEDLVLDLKQVSDCDSAFVALLTACLQIKSQQQKALSLANSPRKLLAMLEVYHLQESGLRISGV